MQTETISYKDNSTSLEGFLAFNPDVSGTRPAILVAHDWSGRNDFACKKAEELAKLGYVGFALDMFGVGKFGNTKEEKSALITPLLENRHLLLQRVQAAFDTIKNIDVVDKTRIGAIGFCFGGMCVLDLARSDIDLKGVVSFHGLLHAPDSHSEKTISAKILALHGHDDPMVSPEQVNAFQKEMTEASADWQVHVYGNTMHAFTNPLANDPNFGTVYNPLTAQRAWSEMERFFEEIF